MSAILLALIVSLELDFHRDKGQEQSFVTLFAPYRTFTVEERDAFCVDGDTLSCLMRVSERILDEKIPADEVYGELSGARASDPEFAPQILVGQTTEAMRAVAIYLFVADRWRQLDPGMIRDLINEIGEPYFSRLHPLYLRRLADLGRMAEFVQEYRPVADEGVVRIYLRELLRKDPEEAFAFLKGLGMKLSEEFEDEVDALFTAAWAGKKEQRRDYLLWQMYTNYRSFRYDRCLRIGKKFAKSDAAKDITDWRAGLLRAMANTRLREHQNAIEIYKNLEGYLDRFEFTEDDIHDLYRWGGYSYAALGKNPESIDYYLKGYERLASAEKSDSFLYYAADMERLTENWSRAEELYLKLLAEHPETEHRDVAEFLVFWIRYLQKRYDEAFAILQNITQATLRNSYDGLRARYWTARVDEKQGRDAEAVAAFREIAVEQPLSYYGMLAASRLRAQNIGVEIPVRPPAAPLFDPEYRSLPELQWIAALWLTGHEEKASSLLWLTRDTVLGSGLPEDRLFAAFLAREVGSYGLAGVFIRSLPVTPGFSGEIVRMQYPVGYEEEIVPHAALYGVSPLFVFSIARQESMFEAKAVSPSNAIGILQLLPGTAQLLAKEEDYGGRVTTDLLKKPFTNARFGVKFLGGLLKRYQGSMALAAAAYNAGPGKIDRWLKRMEGMELDELIENIPIFQTRNYVKKVLANYASYRFLYEGELEDRFEFILPVKTKPVSQK
jgi:soluble lytic murein transglycosylase